MNTSQAFELITQVCEKFIGTKQDHDLLQEAIKTIKDKIQAEPKKCHQRPIK